MALLRDRIDEEVVVELVVAARAGEPGAMDALVTEFAGTVISAAYGITGDATLAADVAQEAFATVVARIGDLREPAAFPGWLMAIVRTSASRALRGRIAVVEPRDRPADDAGPEAAAIAADERERVRLAVEALPPHLRIPVVLHYVAGSSIHEIAVLCDVPVSTVKQRMRVARARLREGMDEMAEDMLCRLAPRGTEDATDVIRFFVAMRSGDTDLVASILDARPDLVDVREHWTRDDSFAHRLPWTGGGGTPLLRGIERGDDAMVRLLLDRGADPNGACTCAGGERPLWTAVAHGRTSMVDELLARGADPNAVAFEGATPLDVATVRGYVEIADRLRAAGAMATSPWTSSPPVIGVADGAAMVVTGIKAVDLLCSLPARGVARLTPGFGLGAVVLIAELSYRFARSGRDVVWTGFVPAPTDLGDWMHELVASGLGDVVQTFAAPPTAPRAEQVAAFEGGVAAATDGALLVIFEETGYGSAIEERLPELARRDGTTIVVGPLDGSAPPPKPTGTPYLASITFDIERARRRQWPAISGESWSKAVDSEGALLGAKARELLDHDGEMHAYLSQPFYVADLVLSAPGTFVPLDQLRREVTELVG